MYNVYKYICLPTNASCGLIIPSLSIPRTLGHDGQVPGAVLKGSLQFRPIAVLDEHSEH